MNINQISVYGIWYELQNIEVADISQLSYKEFYGTSFSLKLVGICNSIKNQNKVTESKAVTNKLRILRNDIVHCTSQKQWDKTGKKMINILKYIKNLPEDSLNFDETEFDLSKLLIMKHKDFINSDGEKRKVSNNENDILEEIILWN